MASIQSKIIRAAPGWLSGRSVQLSILAKPHIGCTDYFFTILKKKKIELSRCKKMTGLRDKDLKISIVTMNTKLKHKHNEKRNENHKN